MRLLREPFVTVLAQKRFFPCVHQQVLLQLSLGGESLAADFAVEIFLARVDFDVGVQITGAGKSKRLILVLSYHSITYNRQIPFGAICAAVRTLRSVYRYGMFG